ncbi:glutathione S-transferase family protein [Rhodobacteraceae bacterium]|nr:glutathione S-transferase family protein [Paracoccaceae bacterium]
MLTLHCLAYSRALRIVWLLEELNTPYQLEFYDRTKEFRAPDALKKIHPLGKSPVIEDDGLVLAESSAILRYIDQRYGHGRHQPADQTPAFFAHNEWLDLSESSGAQPVIAAVMDKIAGKDTVPENPAMADRLGTFLDYVGARLEDRPFLMGDTPMLADIQISYLLALADRAGVLDTRPVLAAYWQRLQDQPGFQAAVAKAGPMAPPAH